MSIQESPTNQQDPEMEDYHGMSEETVQDLTQQARERVMRCAAESGPCVECGMLEVCASSGMVSVLRGLLSQ